MNLTKRELEIMKLHAQGFTRKEIADILLVSIRTVDYHTTNALHKSGCRRILNLLLKLKLLVYNG